MRTLLAGALALLVAVPASAQIRKFQDWIAACDNQRNCVAYSWNRDTYNAYLRIQRDGAPSADARLTLALARDKPITFKVEAAADPGLLPPGPISDLPVDNDGHIRLSVEAPAAKITAWVRKTQKLLVYQLDPPMSDPGDRKLDGVPLTGALAALAWIDERQLRQASETAFVRRGKKSVVLLPPQQAQPVVTAAKPGNELIPTQHPPEIVARANATCGRESIDAEHVRTVRLAAGQLLYWFFCGQYSGAAGLNHAFLLVPDGNARAAVKPRFVLPSQVARHIKTGSLKIPTNKDAVFNPQFDPATLTLTSFSLWRAAGDCGEFLKWVWTGREFQVAEFSAMPECEGLPPSDWPVLYNAQVK
jgi:hypothetical protein